VGLLPCNGVILEVKKEILVKTILLIEPPFNRLYNLNASLNKLPLSLGYLAGAIISRKPDWQAKIYSADFSPHDAPLDYQYLVGPGFQRFLATLNEPQSPIWKEIRDTINRSRPSVVGITAKSQNYSSACAVAKIAKSIDRNILVVVGGPHPSLAKTEVLKEPATDIGVLGEGEETIVEILNSAEGNQPLSSIKGIVYREGNNIVENPPREFIRDLDSLPFPVSVARTSLIDYDKYPPQAFKYIFAVRGCPYNCSFCGSRYIWSRKTRFRSVENIVAEIQEITKIVNYVHFDDDTFGVKKPFIHELCSAIKENCPGLSWSCEIHVKLVDNETIGLMKSAGCRSIQLGVESGSNEMLKSIGKNITIEEAFSAANTIKKHKIYLQTFFMVGFPQETESTLSDTISAMTSFPSDNVMCSIFTPYLGTELFSYCEQHGIIPQDFDVSLYNHQSPENYFCPNIARDVFKERIRRLGKALDGANSRRKLKMYFSREGYMKLEENGIRRSIPRLLHFCQKAIRSR
jgi:radical SAM superfamily enzyme YgiQ (UPF0313 family)